MATAPINRPKAIQYLHGETPSFRPTLACANGTAFKQFQFVASSGAGPTAVLTKCAAAATSAYGLSVEDASATGTGAANIPPAVLYAGTSSTFDPDDVIFVVNITDGSGTIGSGTTTQGAVTIGTSYNMIYAGTGDTDCQMLNAASSANPFFKVEGFFPDDASTAFNGRVLASFVGTRQ